MNVNTHSFGWRNSVEVVVISTRPVFESGGTIPWHNCSKEETDTMDLFGLLVIASSGAGLLMYIILVYTPGQHYRQWRATWRYMTTWRQTHSGEFYMHYAFLTVFLLLVLIHVRAVLYLTLY